MKTFAVQTLTALVGSFVFTASIGNDIHGVDSRNNFHLVVRLWCIAARLRWLRLKILTRRLPTLMKVIGIRIRILFYIHWRGYDFYELLDLNSKALRQFWS